METHEVIIIGGGPAGSSCAWRLKRHGMECLVLDRQAFPRAKLCAGWITPAVVRDLEIDVERYPHRFLTFERIHTHMFGLGFKLKAVQHSIRRYEFDAWLLQRSGAPVHVHNARVIRREQGYFIIDDQYRCRYLVGASGTQCPVYRTLFRDINPRAKTLQAVTLEEEFPYDWRDPNCHLWFFSQGLPGYSWYVPKADGYLNIGVGGMAHKLRLRGSDIKRHWQRFTQTLERGGLVKNHDYHPGGYSYFVRAGVEAGQLGNAFIVGDAAGLATRDLCEGIGPAVKSGLLAADTIAGRTSAYTLSAVETYSSDNGLMRKGLEYMFISRRETARDQSPLPTSAADK